MSEDTAESNVADVREEETQDPSLSVSESEDLDDSEAVNTDESEDLGEEIDADDLGIDLASLKLPSSGNVLGAPKTKPRLETRPAAVDRRPVGRPVEEDEGLFAWCEQFNYSPGIDYLRLERLHPKLWEGLSISGFIEDIYEPIDEHWLSGRWGGGSYAVTSYQRDASGRTRKGKSYTIEISGMPRAYMGQDGEPHLLNNSHHSSRSSKRSADVLKRRMGMGKHRGLSDRIGSSWDRYDDDDDEEIRPRPRARPTMSNVDAPLQDASKLYQTIQESKKSEAETLGVLREAQKDVQEQMQRTSQQQSEMYKQLLAEQKALAENSSAPFKDMLQFMMAKGDDSASKQSLEALRDAHDRALKTMTSEHSRHITDLRANFESRLSSLTDELNRQRLEYAQSAEKLRLEYIEKERSAKDDSFRQYQAQIDVIRTQNTELRERHRDELSSISREKNEMIAAMRQEISELKHSLLQKDADSRAQLIERENTLRNDFIERENKLHRQVEKLQSEGRTEKVEYRALLQEEFKEKFENFKESLKESYEAKLSAEASKIDDLRSRLDSVRDTVTATFEIKLEAERSKFEELKSKFNEYKEAERERFDAFKDTELQKYNALLAAKQQEFDAKLAAMETSHRETEKLELERRRISEEAARREKETQKLVLETSAKSSEALTKISLEQAQTRLKESQAQILRLEKELNTVRSSVEPSDPFSQLEKLNAIKQRLKDHGFVTEEETKALAVETPSEPKDDTPKDLLGKIVHYGPALLGPILQRVDQATSIAQQSLAQQKEAEQRRAVEAATRSREEVAQQQRLLEQQQAQAQAHENTMRARRELLLQKRAEREQAIARESHMREQAESLAAQREPAEPQATMVEVAQPHATMVEVATEIPEAPEQPIIDSVEVFDTTPPSLDPSTQTSQEESIMSAEQEAYTKLAEYLTDSIASKKTPKTMSNELKFARMTGMFSKEAMDSVLAQDFEYLVAKLSEIKSDLRKPRSREILKNLMTELKK